uniref:PGG domain-containing protein n=1 Tax=Aegilops tauschii subsp. strangulata TaxID=200361 RepID=A0A453GK27_AEGTS
KKCWGHNLLKLIHDLFSTNKESAAQQDNKLLEKNRSLVMLLATLVVSITYAAGLDPPGGLWPDDRDGHKGGDPVLLATHPTRYKVFFYSNSVAFVTSLVVIVMVQSTLLLQHHILHAAMILDLFGLITAYAAGSGRDFTTSIYVVALAGVVLVYVVIHIVFFTLEDNMDQVHQRDADKLDKRRDMLLLLAILAATLTYQAGLTPPGGFWSADDKFGHRAGFPVFLDNYPRRYSAFFYCNAASFMASVTLIVLLVNPTLYKPGIRCYALYVCTVVSMFGLMGAYAAGSSRHLRTSIYVFTLVAAVFAFLTIQVVIFLMQNHRRGPTVNVSSGKVASDTGTEEKNLREYLMPIGVLAASVTYQTGLKPPGGLWQDNNNGHTAGNSILHDTDRGRYRAFFYSNSTSFMASIVVIVLLLPWKGLHLPLGRMYAAILLDMLGLLVAYAAGSTREWETSSLVIALVVPVLAYIAAYAAVFLFRNKCQCGKGRANEDSA